MIIKSLEIRKSLAAVDVFIKNNHLANVGAYNQRHVLNCVITILSYEKKHDLSYQYKICALKNQSKPKKIDD